MISYLILVLWVLAIPAAFCCAYLLLLTLLSSRAHAPTVGRVTRKLRFDIIVPAHNERALIERVVRSLLQVDWAKEDFRVIVVADNCTDDTASLARAMGVTVLERRHNGLRGKGYALEFAFLKSQSQGWADALIVVDADSEVSSNLLKACAARIENGAHVVQVHYGVLDPCASWRTRLLCIAMAAFHRVRSRGREHMGLSCGLRGNGWCVTQSLLLQVPYRAFSLAEDIEYGIELGLAGYRVWYADEAYVDAEMVADAQTARTQRRRWEHGRFQLIRSKTATLLWAALRQRSLVCLDLAADLLVLPLSYVALNVLAFVVYGAAMFVSRSVAVSWLWLACACAVSLMLYVLRGWWLSGMGLLGLIDLARAPFFIAWKVLLMLQPRESLEWVRTKRRAS